MTFALPVASRLTVAVTVAVPFMSPALAVKTIVPLAGLPSACVAVAVRFALVPSFGSDETSLPTETDPLAGLTVVLLQADAKAAIAATVSALNSIFTGSSRAGIADRRRTPDLADAGG